MLAEFPGLAWQDVWGQAGCWREGVARLTLALKLVSTLDSGQQAPSALLALPGPTPTSPGHLLK